MSDDYRAAVADLAARGPGRMLPDLDRITQLADLLGNPQRAYPSVHVTGTNGKGSTVRMLATLFAATGLKAGAYTSPHLQSVRERLSLAGRAISEARFAEIHAEVAPLAAVVDTQVSHPDDHVTYFELLTAMAYWWFADGAVDVGVFEVGMGGTWDATNLVRGEVAVLTDIDVDHPQLGETPAEVAREKAGIIKPGARVISADQPRDVEKVLQAAAAEQAAELQFAGEAFDVVDRGVAVGGQTLRLRVGDREIDDVFLPLFGAHQAQNAAVALAGYAALLGDAFDRVGDDLVRSALAAVTTPGRLEIVHRDPTVVLDGAHNPHGARRSAAALGESFGFRNLVGVFAAMGDKDLGGILGAFRDEVNHVVVTRAPVPRAADLDVMARAAREVWAGSGVVVEVAPDVPRALELATGVAGEGDGVLVAGSLYTVGAARDVYLPLTDPGDDVVYGPDDVDEGDDEAEFQQALDRMLDQLGE